MVTSRGAFFLGLSLIICVAMLIYGPQIGKFRYLTVPTNQGLFILDTKTQMMNVCTDKNCRIVPHEAPTGLMPGMQPTYGQMQMASTNSLGVIENTNNNMPFGFNCGNGVCVMPMPVAQQPQEVFQMPQKPVAPVIIEERARPAPAPAIQEIMVPRPQPIEIETRPAVQPVRPMSPAVQTPMVRPPMPSQPPVMQQRPAQPAVRTAPVGQPNLAEAQVLADENNLQAREQALGLG
jgi:hypothetical protein